MNPELPLINLSREDWQSIVNLDTRCGLHSPPVLGRGSVMKGRSVKQPAARLFSSSSTSARTSCRKSAFSPTRSRGYYRPIQPSSSALSRPPPPPGDARPEIKLTYASMTA